MTEEWITTVAAAKESGYQPERIRELLRAGKVEGRKFSTVWMVKSESLHAYVRKMRKRGTKAGPKMK